jgi:glycosyltransferase involved in cell wall biosynthesis
MPMNPRIVEPVGEGSTLLYSVREAGSRLRHVFTRRAVRKQAEGLRIKDGPEPLLNYGRLNEVSAAALPTGGLIKLFPLKKRFPEHFNDFNVMYLVSSALPPHAEEVVRVVKSRGGKLVWNQNGIAYPGCYGDFYPWYNLRMAKLRAQADYVVNQSEFSRISAERYLGRSDAPSEICFNPVDPSVFTPTSAELPEEPWQILAAGTSLAFYRTKSVLDTIRVLLRRGHSVHLTIAGGFHWRGAKAQLRREMKGMEGHVTIHPPFRQEEAPGIYRKAHLLLHTKFNDPCPTVPIEAMSCGLPVVGTHSGGMPELVPGICGILVPVDQGWERDLPGDPESLADAVEQVMQDRVVMSKAAREHAAATFDVKGWMGRHEAVFHQILKS